MSQVEEIIVDGKPELELPGGAVGITETASHLGILLQPLKRYYVRGGVVCRLFGHGSLEQVKPAAFASAIEKVAQPVKVVHTKNGQQTVCSTCSESTARLLLECDGLKNMLPPLTLVAKCPVLLERGKTLATISGYDRETGILAQGDEPAPMDFTEASALLNWLLKDFHFAGPPDKSRALAAMITPALVMGGLIMGRVPMDLGEADASQTGKGYRNKITAAIYNDKPQVVSSRKSGVGGLDEAFDAALIGGNVFISLDNIRGRIDSPAIESFCTEDTYLARASRTMQTPIDPRKVVLMFTSNRADITTDLANRISCVRLLKQPMSYQYPRFPEGDLLAFVRAHQPQVLGAVFAIVRAWHAAGKPRTGETRHDFREWAQVMDWIVRTLLSAAPLLDGHRETQARITSPVSQWVRDALLAVVRSSSTDLPLSATDILSILETDGTVEIPGAKNKDLADREVRKAALQQIGRNIGAAFSGGEIITVDNLTVERYETTDDEGRKQKRYRVAVAY